MNVRNIVIMQLVATTATVRDQAIDFTVTAMLVKVSIKKFSILTHLN